MIFLLVIDLKIKFLNFFVKLTPHLSYQLNWWWAPEYHNCLLISILPFYLL